MIFGWLLYLTLSALLLWYLRVIHVRRQFKNEQGKLVPGSNWPPISEYFRYGFFGRNILAPHGEIDLSFPLGFPIFTISEPSVIKELMHATKSFDKGEWTVKGVEPVAGRENLFSSDGTVWQHQRRISNPAFRPQFIANSVSIISRVATSHIESWGNGPVNDISEKFNNMALEVICAAAFGVSGEQAKNYGKHFRQIINASLLKLIGLGPCLADKQLKQAGDAIESDAKKILVQCREAIKARQTSGPSSQETGESKEAKKREFSLIELLIEAEDEEGSGDKLTERQVIDNVKIFLFAGHESTASVFLWIFYLLALPKNKKFLDKLLNELESQFGTSTTLQSVTNEQVTQLEYLECIVKETLRLYPPAWTINRSPKIDNATLGGYSLPKGTNVMINTLRLHRRTDLWGPTALEFNPDRWLDEQVTNEVTRIGQFSYLPFGAGPRICIGMPFAKVELKVVTAMVLMKYRPHIDGPLAQKEPDINFFAGSTIRPKGIQQLRFIPKN